MNSVLLNLGFIQIRWYSILVLTGFILGYFLVINRCKKKGISTSLISDMCFYLIIVCLIGARLYYCLFRYYDYTNIIDIFKVWEGGLAIHGGIIAGAIFLYFYTKRKNINFLELLDIFAPALVLGQAIGRWGNFFNQEAFGRKIELSLLEKFHLPKFIINGMYIFENGEYAYRTPTFLIESIACILIFIILIIIRNRKNIKDGQVISIYLVLYGIERFFVEGLRTDSLMFFSLRIAQIVSIVMILLGIYLFIRPYVGGAHDNKRKVGHSLKR